MSTCTHDDIDVYFLHDGTPAKFWGCANCMVKFVPITNELRLERDIADARAENERLREALSALTSACTESKWPLVSEHMMPMTLARAALAAKE